MSVTTFSPQAGPIEDIEREDDRKGYEPEIAHQRLGNLLARIVTETDARIPAVRRAPRTVAEMRARINIAAGRACSLCGGQGGQVVDTSSGGVTRRNWQSCGDCGGTGESR
ncbi:DnaJ-like cysteine-rich domain-containing protein [Streptomyces salyersiae]|uniref:DksA C4-type domain-containing protein n=1 Tax=Streptomyces salyersiae TaxID=3075530 RepID=A0ABU2RVN5_9ACTN|nr:hypothetical protein [Streptomyces sp. DSM 41770]MDT0432895.1 hypothetical protein [Streptomyces sp. DSM 41770]